MVQPLGGWLPRVLLIGSLNVPSSKKSSGLSVLGGQAVSVMTRGDDEQACSDENRSADQLLGRLFRTEAPRLARFIRRSVSDHDDVQDLVQDTFVSFVSVKAAKELRTPQAYLRTIARNLLWGRVHRAPLRERAVHVPFDDAFDLGAAPEQEWMMEATDFLRRYETALAELPARTREVFRLSRQEELSYQQIADRLGLHVRGVKYHMKKALLYLDHRMHADD